MDNFAKEYIREKNIKEPSGYFMVDDKENISIEKTDLVWHNKEHCFYDLVWWKTNEPKEPNILKGFIIQDMIVLRKRIYESVRPKKQIIMKNIKLLIQR